MKHRRWLIVGLLTITTVVLCLLIWSDWIPILRGPTWLAEEWRWPYYRRPLERLWLPSIASITMLAAGAWWLRGSGGQNRKTITGLLFLVLANLFLQGSLIYAERTQVAAETVDRNLALQTSGYFRTAADIQDLGAVLRIYPSQMTTFDSEHARTHPPGLIIGNWSLIRISEAVPTLATRFANWIRPLRCTDLWVLDSPDHVLAGLVISALIAPLSAALAIPLAYYLAKQIGDDGAARLATILVATLPALLLFTPLADQLLAFLILLGMLLFFLAQQRRSVWLYFASGTVISLASFASIGVLAILVVAGVLLTVQFWQAVPDRQCIVKWAGAMLLGLCAAWFAYWILWGITPWEIALTAMEEHYHLVTSRRQYGVWLGFNLLDLIIFAGTAVMFGAIAATVTAVTRLKTKHLALPDSLAIGLSLMIGLLLLSGTTRGEVGRIWLFILPFLAITAGLFLWNWLPGRQAALVLVGLNLALAVAMGMAWRPVEAVIVRAERPSIAINPEPMTDLEIDFEEGVKLVGYTVDERIVPGGLIGLMLTWQAEGPSRRPYTVFAHLVDEDGRIVAQQDNWPVQGQWPPTCWRAGDFIADPIQIQVPHDVAPGDYQLIVGMYDSSTGQRLRLTSGSDAVTLTTVMIGAEG